MIGEQFINKQLYEMTLDRLFKKSGAV